jgi:hypothetical protein
MNDFIKNLMDPFNNTVIQNQNTIQDERYELYSISNTEVTVARSGFNVLNYMAALNPFGKSSKE